MAYKGDSPSKKLVRYFVWEMLERRGWDSGWDLHLGNHLVLCSHEAGDVSLLKGVHVSPRNIWAVDTDLSAIEAARRRFPDVRYHVGDVFDFSPPKPKGRPRPRLKTAFLDLCCHMNEGLVDKIASFCARNMEDRFVFVVGYMRGRERDSEMKQELYSQLAVEREARRGDWDVAYGIALRTVTDLLSVADPASSLAERNKTAEGVFGEWICGKAELTLSMNPSPDRSVMRANILDMYLARAFMSRMIEVHPIGMLNYLSSDSRGRGVPMTMALFKGWRVRGLPDPVDYVSRCFQYAHEDESHETLATERDIRDLSLTISDRHGARTASLVMNVDEKTIVAWRACRTAGKYPDSWDRVDGGFRFRLGGPSNYEILGRRRRDLIGNTSD